MSKAFDEMVAHLKWLNFWIRHFCDQAEAKMAEVNRLLEQLAQTGWLQETVILGPVIHQRYYVPLSGGHDSSQVVQVVGPRPVAANHLAPARPCPVRPVFRRRGG